MSRANDGSDGPTRTSDRMTPDECVAYRVASAFHESGHAMLAAISGLLGESVSIDPTDDCSGGPDAGETKVTRPSDAEDLRSSLDARTVFAVAGREAQAKAINEGLTPYQTDRQRAYACLNASNTDLDDRAYVKDLLTALKEPSGKEAVIARYERAAPEAQRILGRDDVWGAFRELAGLLVRERKATREEVSSIARAHGITVPDPQELKGNGDDPSQA